jgi:integrase
VALATRLESPSREQSPAVRLSLTKLDRGHVVRLIDKIAAGSPRLADMVKVDLQAIERWFAERNPGYVLQFMGTIKKRSTAKPRSRVLDSEKELPLIWAAAGKAGIFGALVKTLLYTAQRRKDVIQMRWNQVDLISGEWLIPHVDGEKGHPKKLVLPPAALDVLKGLMQISPYVFPSTRGEHLAGLSQLKCSFDARLPPMQGWTLHDLRRSARTYMSEADVQFHVAERILGHALGGVADTYDRAKLERQTTAALVALADYIEKMVSANTSPMTQVG